ncbi:MAG TPA: porin family protein [Flavobacterium sp.]|nr:porin family protein [Flavobacterium sp.]
MKKIIVLILLTIAIKGNAQNSKSIFGRDPIINLENWQKKKIYFGFFLGFNSYDFKIDYKRMETDPAYSTDIQTDNAVGFNVGLVTNVRLMEYLDLRFEPGLYYANRTLHYPPTVGFNSPNDAVRDINSTYINFPLLLKFSSLRTGNVRPYLLGGVSANLNLSSNANSLDDNLEERFRVKSWTTNYELGFGIDIFSEYFIFSPSIRGQFGISDELIRDKDPNSPWTGNIEAMKSRGVLINFTFH